MGRQSLLKVVLGLVCIAYSAGFVLFHSPYFDTGILGGYLKYSLQGWDTFMLDPEVLAVPWCFGKPIFLFFILLYQFLPSFEYGVLPVCLMALILVNGVLSRAIFRRFFSPTTADYGALLYGYLLSVTYWLCALRNEIYLVTIANLVFLSCLRYLEDHRIRHFYFSIVLVGSLALPIHTNCLYLYLFLTFFFFSSGIYRTHFISCLLLGFFGSLAGMAVIVYPGVSVFLDNMRYLANYGERFQYVVKFFQIVGIGLYKNGYQYPFAVCAVLLAVLNARPLLKRLGNLSPREKTLLLFGAAVCAYFLFIPSAGTKIYSAHFLLLLAFAVLYPFGRGYQTDLTPSLSILACGLLLLPIFRESRFHDKAGVIIPCGVFLVLLLASRFRIRPALLISAGSVFLCVNLAQLYFNQQAYLELSAVLRQTGSKQIVTDPRFEFLGRDYDIRNGKIGRNALSLQDTYVVLISPDDAAEYGITRKPDRRIEFHSQFIPLPLRQWYLYLPNPPNPQ